VEAASADTPIEPDLRCRRRPQASPAAHSSEVIVKVFEGLVTLWPVVLWVVGGAMTFPLNVMATWTGDASLPMKLLRSLTVDLFLAAWWPVTWSAWGVQFLLGPTTLDLVVG